MSRIIHIPARFLGKPSDPREQDVWDVETPQSVRAAWLACNRERAAINKVCGTKFQLHPRPRCLALVEREGA